MEENTKTQTGEEREIQINFVSYEMKLAFRITSVVKNDSFSAIAAFLAHNIQNYRYRRWMRNSDPNISKFFARELALHQLRCELIYLLVHIARLH